MYIKMLIVKVMVCLMASVAIADEYNYCMYESPIIGKIKFRAITRHEAFEKTVRACLSRQIEQYVTLRYSTPSEERKILFLEECVNRTFCKRSDKE